MKCFSNLSNSAPLKCHAQDGRRGSRWKPFSVFFNTQWIPKEVAFKLRQMVRDWHTGGGRACGGMKVCGITTKSAWLARDAGHAEEFGSFPSGYHSFQRFLNVAIALEVSYFRGSPLVLVLQSVCKE